MTEPANISIINNEGIAMKNIEVSAQKRVLAIHDISCVGRCSLTVALPIISAAGIDCGVLPTAVLSTHTGGFSEFTYRDLTDDIKPITRHWENLGLRFDGIYSGFLGSLDQIEIVAEIFDRFRHEPGRRANSPAGESSQKTLVMADPVFADNGRLYSVYTPEISSAMAKLCSHADIIVPNLTEAAFMLNEPYVGDNHSKAYIKELLVKLADLGAPKIVLTGVSLAPDKLGAAAYDSITGELIYADNERINGSFHGTGDVFSSALFSSLVLGHTLGYALEAAVNYTHRCITLTVQAGQEIRYGVCFERALGYFMELMNR